MPDLNDIYVLLDGQVAAPIFALLCHFRMLPGSWRKVRKLSADAVSYCIWPRAEAKKSPFDFSAKKIEVLAFQCCKDSK
jgi:hypothetical protein